MSVETAGTSLGLDPKTPLLGYYLKEDFLAQHPGLAQALFDASRDAKDLVSFFDDAWKNIRPKLQASSDADFQQLKTNWITGIPERGPVDRMAAGKMFKVMRDLGGDDLVGPMDALPSGLFADV